ncbi:hypothetical protein AZF00_00790 [Zhongshania aliphaticivorans]|uniref:Uncharacterized protein n=1 Tax=Zhongshania aliphaticivorans TaxID=1470434 RepID=A0A127M114_9GAMM|nr:hypothetical protein AZF00_00790 [Zhongshania aliphaticivorans]
MAKLKAELAFHIIDCICNVISTLLEVLRSDIDIMRYIHELWAILHQLAFAALDWIVGAALVNYLGFFIS